MPDFAQIQWDDATADSCRHLVRLAIREDLDRGHDWTTLALVPEQAPGAATLVTRQDGVIAGLPAARVVIDEAELPLQWTELTTDGAFLEADTPVAEVSGSARHLLTLERILLNLVGRLSGVASVTQRFVRSIADSPAKIYDTRKTTPGWRLLEKYAVRCGGGRNHRLGLFDAILIKDNHLCLAAGLDGVQKKSAAEAVTAAQQFARSADLRGHDGQSMLIEVEVDTLAQLRSVLPAGPDIVLLDNMSLDQLAEAVSIRNQLNRSVELEASGGVTLRTAPDIAQTGVERISVGALTHSAVSLDIGLDWKT